MAHPAHPRTTGLNSGTRKTERYLDNLLLSAPWIQNILTGSLEYRNVTDDHEVDRLMSLYMDTILEDSNAVAESSIIITYNLLKAKLGACFASCLDHV